jgi:hypothetical protein
MLAIYCIPGMGVDERLFKNLQVDNCQIHYIKWITPLKNESLPDYALRLSKQIDSSKPFALLGVSFGGMCATEIAKQLHPLKTFVISSCKIKEELPLKLTIWKYIPLYKIVSDIVYKRGAMIFRRQFGVSTKEQRERFKEMMDASPKNYFKGAVHCIMSWENKIIPISVVHIHGTADKILPIKKLKVKYVIEGGSHFMIINKAAEINQLINAELKDIT